MSSAPRDLIVVGGGPAGTTLAALIKKYDPKREVLLLEKAAAPRHHVGESLQPGCALVLKDMGVLADVERAGFLSKLGAVYVWGGDRKPWGNDFAEANKRFLSAVGGRVEGSIRSSWQVLRSRYDELLLRHAEKLGVRVARGALAQAITEEDGRITGVVYRDAEGKIHEERCEYLADCSGQNGFLSKFRKIREYNPKLKNVAAYAYYRGARWDRRYTGRASGTRTFLCSAEGGWFWAIPISEDVLSIGFVTSVDHLKKNRLELRALYFDALKKCPEVRALLRDAERIENFDGSGQDFFTQSDWSYLNVAASGPGWLAVGDAAIFVDPILSSGVLLAHLGAQRAAYTLLTRWKDPAADPRGMLWRDYDVFCREFAAQFLSLALFWYGNDRNAAKWRAQAKEIQRGLFPAALSVKAAFITVSTGLSEYYQRMRSTATLISGVPTQMSDQPFYEFVLKGDPKRKAGAVSAASRPRLLCPYESEYTYLPIYGEGVLRPFRRIRFLKQDSKEPLRDVFNPKRVASRYHLELLGLIDGRRTMAELRSEAAGRGVPANWLENQADAFLRELVIQGVLELGAKPSAKRPRARR